MTDTDQKQVQSEAPESTCVFVSGDDFFVDRVDLSADLNARDLHSALEMHLEATSPFHVDQLGWGGYYRGSSSQGIVFAAVDEVIAENSDGSASSVPVFPSFLPFLDIRVSKPCTVCCVNGSVVSLLVFDSADALPLEIHSVACEQEVSDVRSAQAVAADMLRDLPVDLPAFEGLIYRLVKTDLNWKNQILFFIQGSNGDEAIFTGNGRVRKLADVREASLKSAGSRTVMLNQVLWFGALGCIALLIISGLISVFNLWTAQKIDSKRELYDSQQSLVAAIESKSRSLGVFESGSSATLQPLSMLEILNKTRPDGLFFTQVRAFEGRKLQIEGVAESEGTALVDRFRIGIEQEDLIRSANIQITRIADGATFFKLDCEFNDMDLLRVGEHQ
jgi:hypothetical protein